MLPVLQTPRLTLRPITEDDLPAMHAMLSDPEIMRYWSSPPHASPAQSLAWIAANRAAVEAGTAIEYGAIYQGKLIGRGTFWSGNELGYIFDKTYWGQGFARECLTAMINYAFETRDWADIVADIDPRNMPSWKILQRLGFQRSGFVKNTFCIGEQWSDSLYFALTRDAWQARQR